MDIEDELDVTKLKYVLYARKSTDDASRQVRSIEDQIADCKDIAVRKNLNIVEIIRETKSAKKANQRPEFKRMLANLKKGVYDSILSWNPDRLARNMREGGEIIDMIDEGKIIDLKFYSHHFSKDANGKMLLGMAFALSKHYSDDLSQKVGRGVRRNLSEGKSPIPKHGYFRDDNGLYQPDEEKFQLIQKAWNMRADGTSLEEIAEFLNSSGYQRSTKRGRSIIINKQILSVIFKDSFYYGVLLQGKHTADLRTLGIKFQPMITEDIYNKVQNLGNKRSTPFKGKRTAFYPLKMMVICNTCCSHMYAAPSRGAKGDRYLYYRCDNKLCTRKKRSIRGKVIFDFIYKFLENGLNLTENEYNNHYNNIIQLSDEKRDRLKYEIHSKEGALKHLAKDIRERALGMGKFDKGSEIWRINEEKIRELTEEKTILDKKLKELKEKEISSTDDHLSIEQFLNLSKNAELIVKSGDAIVKDQICRLIFLNLFCR